MSFQPDYSNNFDFGSITDANGNPTFDFSDPPVFGAPQYNPINANANNVQSNSNLPVQSTEIVRRPRNNQLAQQHHSQYAPNMNGQAPQDDEGDLDEATIAAMVAQAKQGDGSGKRKDIPPFVKKLSNFLNQENRTNLIRWSDDGKSFIVLDEDEFARTMIPELFKHNNYASFVRQLNMYGFHKAVDIKDGSLQQSELARSNKKPPSTYKHKFFQRNRPDLLWLISKPNAKSNAKRPKREGKDGGYDSDEDRYNSPVPEGRPSAGLAAVSGSQDVIQLPRNELNTLKQELSKLQQQQTMISTMINKLKQQNDQFYRQASQFQSLHDRHESSINAILTFLATFYNRSLEDHDGQNLVNMFSNVQNNQPQGGVVEEFNEGTPENTETRVQRYKRPQLLLTGSQSSPSPGFLQPGNAATTPNSRTSTSPPAKRESSASVPPRPQTRSPAISNDGPDVMTNNDQLTSAFQGINQSHGHPSQLSGGNRDQLMEVLNSVSGNGNSPTQAMQDIVANNANSISQLENQQRVIGQGIKDVEGKVQRLRSGFTPPVTADGGFDFSNFPSADQGTNAGPENFDKFVNYEGDGTDGGDWTSHDFEELLNGAGGGEYADNAAIFGEDPLNFDDGSNSALDPGGVFGKVESLNSSSAASPAVVGEGDGDAGLPERKRMRTG
jgi:heat shock transcription factor